jgi:hypothetical protein
MYHASCTVYYPDQQMHIMYYNNNILYIISTPTCVIAPAYVTTKQKLACAVIINILQIVYYHSRTIM